MAELGIIFQTLGKTELTLMSLEKELATIIEEKTALSKRVAASEQALEAARAEKHELQKQADSVNLTVSEHEEQLKEYDSKRKFILGGGGKNADLAIVAEKIEDIKADQSILEEKLIRLWERTDAAQIKISEAENKCTDTRKDVALKSAEFEKRIVSIKASIADTQNIIQMNLEELRSIDAEVSVFYKRLQDKSVRPAAAALDGSNCQGCFYSLPPDIVNKIRVGSQALKCPNCYRFLYYTEEQEEPAEASEKI